VYATPEIRKKLSHLSLALKNSFTHSDAKFIFESGQEQQRAENWSYNAGYDKDHPRYDNNADLTLEQTLQTLKNKHNEKQDN
jgi:hypothetical protein